MAEINDFFECEFVKTSVDVDATEDTHIWELWSAATLEFSCYAILFIFGLLSNTLLIALLIRKKSQLKNSHLHTSHYWILSLAVADLCSIVICIPFLAAEQNSESFVLGDSVAAQAACRIVPTIYAATDWVGMISVLFLALTRSMVILCPNSTAFQYLQRYQVNVAMIIGTWLLGFLINIPQLVFNSIHSICELAVATSPQWPTSQQKGYLLSWRDVTALPCNESYVIPYEDGVGHTIGQWLDQTIRNPNTSVITYKFSQVLFEVLHKCRRFDDIHTCAWSDHELNSMYKHALLIIWFILCSIVILSYGLVAFEMFSKVQLTSQKYPKSELDSSRKTSVVSEQLIISDDRRASGTRDSRRRSIVNTALYAQKKIQEDENRRVGNVVTLITAFYIICWLPYNAWEFLGPKLEDMYGVDLHQYPFMSVVCRFVVWHNPVWTAILSLKYMHHISNPLICIFSSESFKTDAKLLIQDLCRQKT